jgi:spore maturation protein CgeB
VATRILIAGETGNHCLEMSYYNAFVKAGYVTKLYDTKKAVRHYARFGNLGYTIHRFFPVEAWLRKANKEFTNDVKAFNPDIVIAFTGAEILPGSFAYIKSILPVKLVWYWADPLPNLTRYIHQSLSLTDLVASYSRSSLAVFEQMGAKNTCWLPFAGDVEAHFKPAVRREVYKFDISFIGSWRPERESALKIIYENFPALRFKVSGPYWKRCGFAPIRKLASEQPIFGKDFAAIVQDSFLNLNVIDNSNFPSVNMRFFEILAAGGLELCSAGPEMEDIFIDKQHLLYFTDEVSLVNSIKYALENKDNVEQIKIAGQQTLTEKHLYTHRIAEIQKALKELQTIDLLAKV